MNTIGSNAKDNDQMLQEWYKLRSRTILIGVFRKALFIFEYSSIATSGLYYFRYMIKDENPELYYSIALATVFVTAFFSSVMAGPYLDRTRNLRGFVLVTTLVSVLENILYVVSYSKWVPIVGKALSGLSEGVGPGFAGAMARSYPKNDLVVIFSNVQIFSGIMYAVAPFTQVFLRNVDFVVFGLEINQYNGMALVIAAILVLFEIISYFFLTDLSKHPGHKIWLENEKENATNGCSQAENMIKDDVKIGGNADNTKYCQRNLKQGTFSGKCILADFDLLAILFGNFYVSFIHSLVETSIFMVAVLQFKWSLTFLSVVTTCCVVVSLVAMKLLQKFKGEINNFFLFAFCVVGSWFVMSLLFVTFQLKVSSLATQITTLAIIIFVNMIAGYNVAVWARCLCFSIVPEHHLSTVDSYRFCSLCIGFCFGFLTASYAYNESSIFYPLIITGCVLEFIWLLAVKQRYIPTN